MHSEFVQGVTVSGSLVHQIRFYISFSSVTLQLDDLSMANMKSIDAVKSFILRLVWLKYFWAVTQACLWVPNHLKYSMWEENIVQKENQYINTSVRV